MVGSSRSTPNGFDASGSGDLPPPPLMTSVETFMAARTEVLRQILQTQQQITQQMQQRPPMGANLDGAQMVTTYSKFIGMKPPTFTKAEEPLDADAWVRSTEAKFSAFVLPCSEEHKASFAVLQLHGEALMWWEHFKTMQPAGHEITWTKFKTTFKDHHIPKKLMVTKMKELLAPKQGDDTVYQYAQKFNSLCQYGEHHVDTDAKKMERFRDGLRSELYERLNLLEPNNYHELVNKAIFQEDAMMQVQKEKKRQNEFTSGDGSGKKFCFIEKNVHGSSQPSARGHWRVTPSQHKPSGNFQYRQAQPQFSKPKELPPCICYNCRQPGHYANECPNPRRNKTEQQTQNSRVAKGNHDKKPTIQVKQGQLNFTSNFLSESMPPYHLLLMIELYSNHAF
jgi:hypothetical protein